MLCKRCPHLVRHGQAGPKKNEIIFRNKCGLQIKSESECAHYPFPKVFDYKKCDVYQATCKARIERNDVVPTQDFQYSDALQSVSITDMELL